MAHIGTVYLRVADLDRQVAFYQDSIGLHLHRQEEQTAYLGTGVADLLALIHTPEGMPSRGTTGLYHFALLVPSRADLAQTLKRLADTQTPIQGAADHFVSEAIYLADPEGNGIEIYRDRPRETWYHDGEFRMGTAALDVDGVMGALHEQESGGHGLPDGTIMGHIHLHVASIPAAEGFYHDLIGMDVMVNWHSATFMSYNGYHHHVGANTWSGRTPQPPDALGLDRFVLRVPDQAALDAVLARLDAAGVAVDRTDGHHLVLDPSQNRVALTVA